MIVTIGGTDFTVYADLGTATTYLLGDANADEWRAANDDTKKRALVTATRILGRQPWPAGTTEDPDWQVAIIPATAELASQIVGGYDAANRQSTNDNVKRLKAGSVEQEFFRPGDDSGLRLPLPVWELISRWLGGGDSFGGAISSGTCGRSITERPCGYDNGYVGNGSIPSEVI